MTLGYDCLHLLLPGDNDDDKENTGHSFRLLVVGQACRTQIFSSKTGSWGPIVETHGVLPCLYRAQPGAVVIQGVAHWLCHERPADCYKVLAIRLGEGQAAASAIGEVPEGDAPHFIQARNSKTSFWCQPTGGSWDCSSQKSW
jgi:hypothetical protein